MRRPLSLSLFLFLFLSGEVRANMQQQVHRQWKSASAAAFNEWWIVLHTSRGALLLVCTIARTCTRFSKRQHDAVVYRGKLCVAERSSSFSPIFLFFSFFFFYFHFARIENRVPETVNFQTLVISVTGMRKNEKDKKGKIKKIHPRLKTFDDKLRNNFETELGTSNLFRIVL